MFLKKANPDGATKEYTPSRVLVSVYEWVSAAIAAMAVVAILFSCVLRVVNVSGDSMKNTLQSGDRLVISNLFYQPAYGDIVVITRTNDTPLIKRIIGLPGDHIRINKEDGKVYRNGEALNEPYVLGGVTPPEGRFIDITVPDGTLYVLGDNRCWSLDSGELGAFPEDRLVGRVLFRISPNPGIPE